MLIILLLLQMFSAQYMCRSDSAKLAATNMIITFRMYKRFAQYLQPAIPSIRSMGARDDILTGCQIHYSRKEDSDGSVKNESNDCG